MKIHNEVSKPETSKPKNDASKISRTDSVKKEFAARASPLGCEPCDVDGSLSRIKIERWKS